MSDLYLVHHGILGQKWGIRRYQNPDGSLTEEGRRHHAELQRKLESGEERKETLEQELRSSEKTHWNNALNNAISNINNSEYKRRYLNAVSISAALDSEADATNASFGFMAIPYGRGQGEVAIRYKELQEYGSRYLSEHEDDFASAALKDLGYDDTEAGREILKRYRIMEWMV